MILVNVDTATATPATATPVTDRVLAGLGEAFVERAGPLTRPLVDALAVQMTAVDERVAPTDRGWARVFDLNQTPDPRWVGVVTGTRAPAGLLDSEVRDYVRERPASRRGSPAAIVAAVRAVLTGERRVTLIERDGSPWALTVRVYVSELPPGGVEVVEAAVATQKPVGIVASVNVITGSTYAHMKTVHGPSYTDWAADFSTYATARDHLPEA